MPSQVATLFFVLTAALALTNLSMARGPHYMSNHLAVERSIKDRATELSLQNRRQSSASKGRRRGTRRGAKHGRCSTSSGTSSHKSGGSEESTTQSRNASAAASASTASSTSKTSTSSSSTSSDFSALGIVEFLVENGPGIGSWYRTDSSSDSTNGHSWCGFPYDDSSNGFAPDVSLMLSNFGGDYNKAAEAYCGLEAVVTTPSGVTKTMYILDGFDHAWVRTAGSIDIPKNTWAELYGSSTDDKDVVIQGITWKLTGGRSEQYKFQGTGN